MAMYASKRKHKKLVFLFIIYAYYGTDGGFHGIRMKKLMWSDKEENGQHTQIAQRKPLYSLFKHAPRLKRTFIFND